MVWVDIARFSSTWCNDIFGNVEIVVERFSTNSVPIHVKTDINQIEMNWIDRPFLNYSNFCVAVFAKFRGCGHSFNMCTRSPRLKHLDMGRGLNVLNAELVGLYFVDFKYWPCPVKSTKTSLLFSALDWVVVSSRLAVRCTSWCSCRAASNSAKNCWNMRLCMSAREKSSQDQL